MITEPIQWVKLDMSSISVKQQKAVVGQTPPPILPRDGLFKVGGVKHIGDTRGDDWYTDVVGYSIAGSRTGLQLTVPTMYPDVNAAI
jgi:hypothetical protein